MIGHSTQDLLALLVLDLVPVRRHAILRQLAASVGAGVLVSLSTVLLLWGPRPDWHAALFTVSFWAKWGFVLALAAIGLASQFALARPEGRAPRAVGAIALVIVLFGGAAALQFALAIPDLRWRLLFGATSAACPWLILALSTPLLWGTLWALRCAAPTRLSLAGAAAGLTSGALAAFVYAISCDETGLPFLVVWYGGAIAIASLGGAVLGPKVLRW